ncbi:hypothetical protein [Sulfurirhabdus autotrophica]|uniref:Uncharacterized protein n=2 Tax=Sulfurirhabdus autotrophica TaxID=1706046 RepID=A0A4R3Y7X2_9PROT|nr:hypothetical protein [Sulfurirhabdus autotrophica]TCV86664.1 hypothetical protein EDC63_10625 [Sulfurirhabdus autotrophica]
MNKLHQRVGAISNAHVGADFENAALLFFNKQGMHLTRNFPLKIGISLKKKNHCFDLGSASQKIIIECKSHRWTAGGKVPSAKMTKWNEAMLYFHLSPKDFKKVFFTLHDKRQTTGETLVSYYKRTYFHLIPEDVEFIEFDESTGDIIGV